MSHLSTLLGINVSSPVSDPASHLALPLHKHDFIRSQHHVQSAHASHTLQTWARAPPGQGTREQASGSTSRRQCCGNNDHARRPAELERGLFFFLTWEWKCRLSFHYCFSLRDPPWCGRNGTGFNIRETAVILGNATLSKSHKN